MSELTPIDDELLSAYIDDEVTAAERAIIEADPDSMARVVQLRAVRDAVAAPTSPLGATDRDRLMAAALAASETSPTVTSLTVARTRRARSQRPLIAVAAAVAVIGLAVPVIRSLDLGGDAADTAATSIESAADAPADDEADAAESFSADGTDAVGAGADDGAEMPDAADADAAAEVASAEPVDEAADALELNQDEEQVADSAEITFGPLPPELGEFESVDLLVDRVFENYAEWLDDSEASYLRNRGEIGPDDAKCLEELGLAELLDISMGDQASATIDGIDHVIWLFDDGTVYGAPIDDCAPVIVANYFES